jgi:6-phosphofructokinase
LIPEHPFDFEKDVVEHIREGQYRGKHHHLIIVAEGVGHTNEIAERIRTELGLDTRVTIIWPRTARRQPQRARPRNGDPHGSPRRGRADCRRVEPDRLLPQFADLRPCPSTKRLK